MNACKYSVIFTEKTVQQLSSLSGDLFDYLGSKDLVGKIIDLLESAINSLEYMPERYPVVDRTNWRGKNLRRMIVDNYSVYYYVDNDSKVVLIAAILPSRFDQIKHLKESIERN